jgi:hypothetical protein
MSRAFDFIFAAFGALIGSCSGHGGRRNHRPRFDLRVQRRRPSHRKLQHTSGLNPHGLLPCCLRFAPTSRPVNGKTHY